MPGQSSGAKILAQSELGIAPVYIGAILELGEGAHDLAMCVGIVDEIVKARIAQLTLFGVMGFSSFALHSYFSSLLYLTSQRRP